MRLLLRSFPSALLHAPRLQLCTIRPVTSYTARLKLQESAHLGNNIAGIADDIDNRRTRNRLPGMDGGPTERTALIKECAKTADYDKGWQIFEEISDPTTFDCTAALNLCAKAAWESRAWETWAKIPPASRDVVAFSSMINVCARCKSPEKAEQLFEAMETSDGATPNFVTYSSMVNTFSMAGQPGKSLEFFERIPPELLSTAGLGGRQRVYNSVMIAYARIGNYAKTRELFMHMLDQGITPNVAHFNTMLTACARDGLADIAQGIFELIAQYGLTPVVQTWTILLSCNRRNLGRCLGIMGDMQKAGVEPTGLTYVELLDAYVIAGDADGARGLLASRENFGRWQHDKKFERLLQQVEQMSMPS